MTTARVQPEEVKELVATDVEDSVVLASVIDTMHLFVDEHLLGEGHSEEMLGKIELYLSAHLLTLIEERGGLTRSRLGDADESYANMYGRGFLSTRFGQFALTLDTSGILANLGASTLKAQFRVV